MGGGVIPAATPLPRVSLLTRLSYGLGAVAFGVKDNGFRYLLLFYYDQVLGVPSAYIPHGKPAAIHAELGLDADGIVAEALSWHLAQADHTP